MSEPTPNAFPATMNVPQAAQKLGVTPKTIYDWLKGIEPLLTPVEIPGAQMLVTVESVERVKAERAERDEMND